MTINTRDELREVLAYERKFYLNRMGGGKRQAVLRFVKAHPDYYAWKYVKLLRTAGYYYANRNRNPLYGFLYICACRRKNKLGRKLGIEMNERSCGKGLQIEHTQGIVVNGLAEIGENLILHGNNCIGVSATRPGVPKIGNNVRMGFGSSVFGDVKIADHVTIAAGAVVVNSCDIENAVLAGVPAKIVKVNGISNEAYSDRP